MSDTTMVASSPNFKYLVRRLSRLLYTDPFVHLVIDFLIEH
jgi:hypothetical protein